ncbi:4196_t:CDS:2 [Paraglomus occultum]|uniref:4196_t:CDS:1 n=1 Tax=Paraglomus occultum TaxID=144539 RepID=A0A9N9ATW1_9GLOM|nr:4196_t:CDS:2 [Paraglomus occultum]
MALWSRRMIRVSGTRGPGFNSRQSPQYFAPNDICLKLSIPINDMLRHYLSGADIQFLKATSHFRQRDNKLQKALKATAKRIMGTERVERDIVTRRDSDERNKDNESGAAKMRNLCHEDIKSTREI